jgi:hypothetical protein
MSRFVNYPASYCQFGIVFLNDDMYHVATVARTTEASYAVTLKIKKNI